MLRQQGALLLLATIVADGIAVDMLSGRWPRVTLDGVMGGRSSGQASMAREGGMLFRGAVDTRGGGFAYATLVGGGPMDLSTSAGIWLEYDTVEHRTYGAAPIAFQIELSSAAAARCSLTAAFAVPTTAAVVRGARAWLPLSRFVPKGRHWDYWPGHAGVPAYCGAATAATASSLASVRSWAVGCYYQDGPFELRLRRARADAGHAAPGDVHQPLGSAPAPAALAHALSRARALRARAGAGVGAAQMDALAAAVLEASARQSGDAGLLAALRATRNAPAADRVERLLGAAELAATRQRTAAPTAVVAGAAAAAAAAPVRPGAAPPEVPRHNGPSGASSPDRGERAGAGSTATVVAGTLGALATAGLAARWLRRKRSLARALPSPGAVVPTSTMTLAAVPAQCV